MDWIVGIGEYAISGNKEDRLLTFALGSCVALTAYCPDNKILGMAHIALPRSDINSEKKLSKPGYFADTAVPLVIDKLCAQYGCRKEKLIVCVFGGATSSRKPDIFNIGEKNVRAVKDLLMKNNIKCFHEQTGGAFSRTLEAYVATGEIKVSMQPLIL